MNAKSEVVDPKKAGELNRWQKLAQNKMTKTVFIILVVLACLIRGLDEFATTAATSLQTSIVQDLFVEGQGVEFSEGLSQLSLITTGLLVFAILATLYLTLADRFGRKLILAISIFGMSLGMFLIYLSPNILVHVIGRAVLTFFIATDVHGVYVMEIAPKDKRAILISINSFFGYLSMMLVSVSRYAYTIDGELIWRNVFLLPAVIGLVLTALMIVLGKETQVFLDQRIAFLSKTEEELTNETENKKKKQAKAGGLGKAFKYIFANRQPRMIMIAVSFQLLAVMAFYGYYEAIMTTSGMTTDQVTQALLVYPITSAVFSLLSGFIADKLGRKPAALIYSILAFLGLIAFIFTAQRNVSPYIVGLIYGLQIGCFWSFGGLIGLVFGESVPTEIRSTAIAAKGLISVVISLIAGIGISILVNFVDLATLCLVWGAVTVGISIILFSMTVKETKGVDLEQI